MNIDKLKLSAYISGILIFSSAQHIILPSLTIYYNSLYFIMLTSSIFGCVNYACILLYLKGWGIFTFPPRPYLILIIGFVNALMSFCFIYSTNPERTPVIIQSILLGFAIIPTVIFRKYLLNKVIIYNFKIITLSIILLLLSVILAIIPMIFVKINFSPWIIVYLVGVVLLSLDNALQEKFVSYFKDSKVTDKFTLAFYASLIQLVIFICLFWVEAFFGYASTISEVWFLLKENYVLFFIKWDHCLFLLSFIYISLFLYITSIYCNAISTNYNMILTNLTNQSVAIFYSIFPQLNNGYHTPISYIILSLLLNIISIILWINGEKNTIESDFYQNLDVLS